MILGLHGNDSVIRLRQYSTCAVHGWGFFDKEYYLPMNRIIKYVLCLLPARLQFLELFLFLVGGIFVCRFYAEDLIAHKGNKSSALRTKSGLGYNSLSLLWWVTLRYKSFEPILFDEDEVACRFCLALNVFCHYKDITFILWDQDTERRKYPNFYFLSNLKERAFSTRPLIRSAILFRHKLITENLEWLRSMKFIERQTISAKITTSL